MKRKSKITAKKTAQTQGFGETCNAIIAVLNNDSEKYRRHSSPGTHIAIIQEITSLMLLQLASDFQLEESELLQNYIESLVGNFNITKKKWDSQDLKNNTKDEI